MYKNSKPVGDGKEPDIYIFSDPQWTGAPGQEKVCDPKCLCYFNTETNCAAILGMRYFGEHKKGTLTLAWAIANRNGYASCHGGQKEYTLADGHKFVSAVFGLSGSGKSTLTHAKHGGKYPSIKVLHDDAFIINSDTCASIALEPTYFDKTADYPVDSPDNKYLLTAQNCSATLDEDGKVVLVTEDIRNGNGRAIKSKLWSPNRVDKIDAPVNAIFWIMKDPTIPPIVKLKGASLASVMGATLATKRSSAERLKEGVDPNALVVEPYANPFRTYPLVNDYEKFKKLVAEKYGELVYNGLWFSPLREALDAFVNKTQETVTGDVKLKLYKGNVMNETVASFGDDGGAYNQKDAAGFINLFGLPLKVKALLDQKREANKD